ncbi:MAG TPA: HupE/UreJ family protein [Albitalea sp.]|nr:HupE/UreJ family protein [Albitalea sp.]
MTGWLRPAALALLLFAAGAADAHKPSDSYLTLKVDGGAVTGQWDIALRDLDFAIGLDANGDGDITWGELRARHGEIAAYALARLAVQADGAACTLAPGEQLVDQHSDGAYTVLRFRVDCPAPPRVLGISYKLFSDLDPQHRGLLNLQANGANRSAILGPQAPRQQFELKELNRLSQFIDYGAEGVWHIWVGYDHILFLLSLLLPAVLAWREGRWRAADSFRQAFWEVVRIVTSFTVAHSITLSLATLGVLSLPSRWVESAIALSVVLAALNNVVTVFHGGRWIVAFCFGLIHGFGFASVLADLGLPQGTLLLALVGFNLGVECGQLAIVGVFLPLAFWLRRTRFYQGIVFVSGSLLIAGIAGIWLAERVFNFKLLPF